MKVAPQNIIVLPVSWLNQVKAVIELASVRSFTNLQIMFLEQLTNSIGIVLNSIAATASEPRSSIANSKIAWPIEQRSWSS